LYIRINNALTEKIYFGIGQRSSNSNWYFRVKDPNGNIIYGPTLLPTAVGQQGFIQYYQQAINGPLLVSPLGGYNGFMITPTLGLNGNYYIEFNQGSGTTEAFNTELDLGIFDVTVVNAIPAAIPGRLFSKNWSFNTNSYANQFYGSFFIYGADSSVTKVDLNGMKPYKFRVSCNSWGCTNTGDPNVDRQSRIGFYVPPELKLFLRDPDHTAFPNGLLQFLNSPITLTRCAIDSVCINMNLTKKSDVTILIDRNNNGVYDPGTADRQLFFPSTPQGQNCLCWNAKDGLGNYIPPGVIFSTLVNISTGEVDLPMFDIENHETGFTMSVIRPGAGLFVDSLYYDDQLVGGSSNFAGCAFPCHTWVSNPANTETNTIGNNNTMNTWWFAHEQDVTSNLVMPDFLITNAGPPQSVCVRGANQDSIQLAGTIAYTLSAYNGSKQWTKTGTGTFFPNDSTYNAKYIPSAADITAGSVTLFLTPRYGCGMPTDTLVITLRKTPQLSKSTTNVNCFSQATGSVTLTVSNSVAPYTYNWSNSASTQNISNVSAGTYTVTVTSANGCTATTSATLTQPASALTNTLTSSTNVSCYGGSNGAINLSVSGGTPAYTYQWNNGATSQDLNGLSAGNYTVTVTDSKGCTAITSSVSITQPAAALAGSASAVSDVSCFGGNNGSINLNVTGGTSLYTFNWSNGSTTQNISGISSGNYTVTITDSKGCTFTTSAINVSQPPAALNSNVSSSSNVSCFGGNNGSVNLSVSGGTIPYSYNWSNGATTQNINGIASGNYTVTVTDANGCTDVTSGIVITQPAAALSASASSTGNVSCFGSSTGSINLSVSGGTTPYSYSWSNGASTQNLSNIPAGSYTVTVTDNKGCTHVVSAISITQPAASLSASVSSSNDVSCNGGNNGSINLNVNGGTSPYSYNWSNGTTTQNLTNISSGNYSVTITDTKGCTKSVSGIIISQPASPLSTSNTHTNVNCYGDATGDINLSVSGGTIPYTYVWSNGDNSQDLNNVIAGTYTVTVTDAHACTILSSSITITQPAAPLAGSATTTGNVSCNSGANGAVNLSVSGGTAGYTYNWSNGSTTQNISGLYAGNYVVTIIDSKGCTTNASSTVSQPPGSLNSSISTSQNVSCFGGSNGSINLTVNGGTTPYSYNWSNGATIQDISGLTSGSYTVTVTDANNCINVSTAVVTQPSGTLSTTISAQSNVSCFGGNNGSIDLTVNGGTAPYSFQWSNSSTNEDQFGLSSGNYSVTVTDAHNCTVLNSAITITQPAAALSGSVSASNNVSCYGGSNGSLSLSISGGTSPYAFDWSNGSSTQNLSGLSSGNYSVTITDSKGCTKSLNSLIISQPSAPLTSSAASISSVSCFGGNNGSINLSVNGGTSPFTFAWSNGATTQNISNIPTGSYTATVTDSKGCVTTTSGIAVSQPAGALNGNVSATSNVSCFGGNNGSISVVASGGTAPYSYQWNNGSSSQNLSGISAGTYSVTVTDNNGCTHSISGVVISQPEGSLSGSVSTSGNVSCFGGSNGSITLSVSGGTSPYYYLWSNGTTSQNLSGVSSGSYSVAVTDANNCSTSIEDIVITQPIGALTLNVNSVSNVSCFGGNNGNVTLNTTGGTSPYSYNWSNGSSSQNLSNVVAGSYSVTVTDANGCTDNSSAITVLQPPAALNSNISSVTNVSCFGGVNGSINLSVTGGTSPYSYNWSNGSTTQNLTGVNSGTYTVTITDSKGCSTANSGISISQAPAALSASASSTTDVSCNGGDNGAINLTVNGGTSPYTFQWSNGTSTQNISNLQSGTYTATITDINGCSTTVSGITVNEPAAALDASIAATTNVNCFGGNNGSINLSVNGGTTPYSFQWSNGASTQNISNLSAGFYTVSITDVNQCSMLVSGILINEPIAQLSASVSSTSYVNCFGGNNGQINLTVTGGTTPYSYQWSNGANSQNISSLAAGRYTVTVSDANACSVLVSAVTITQPAASLNGSITASNNVSCFGGNNGSLTLNVGGGTSPYSFNWSNGATAQNLSNVVAGTYSVTVTDINGCTFSITGQTISQPPAALNGTVSASADVSCFGGNNGSINLNISGGTAPYSFVWSNSASTQNLNSLSSGNYSVTITDANGCMKSVGGIVIDQPSQALSGSATTTQNVSCNSGANGTVSLTASGGTAPYSYLWSNGATTQNISGLFSGSYVVTITDAQGCSTTTSATVAQPAGSLASSINVSQNVNCFGGNNGSINLNVSGGTSPYAFNWSNGSTAQNLSNLSSGTYNVTITDAKGCLNNASAAVQQPSAELNGSVLSSDNVNCFGGNNGSINLSVNGGTPPYFYEWTNGASTQNISNLSSGAYTVSVTDANGCTTTVSAITISQPTDPLNGSASSTTNVSCFGGNNGGINLSVNGGTSPYSFQWSNGVTTQNINNLISGTYTATVTDANGCTTVISGIAVSQPPAGLNAAASSTTDVSCSGGNNGAIGIAVNGGTAPYLYQWNSGATTQNISNLISGTYSVTITDANGCSASVSGIAVNQPAVSLNGSASSTTNVSCFGGNNGGINLSVNGGTLPYSYQWNNGATTQDLSNISSGIFTVTVTDANGCTTAVSGIAVDQPAASLNGSASSTSNVSCFGGNNGGINLNVNGGTVPYSYQWSNGESTQNISNLASGTYTVSVSDANGCTTSISGIAINQPAASLNGSASSTTDVSCFGGNNGAINVSVNGGTLPYTYQWNNGASTQDISNLASGTYTVTVTDLNGCTTQVSGITIDQPAASLNGSASSTTNVSCFGGNNGGINLSVNGGTTPYSYQWSNGASTQNLSNISSGINTVTVTDVNGCTTEVSGITIDEPAASLNGSASSTTNVSCFGGNNGGINLSVNGGTTPYSYQWSNGASTQNINNLSSGAYTVTVTDVNGCTTEVSGIAINQPPAALNSSASSTTSVSCFGGNNGAINLNVTGGTVPYSYQWSNGSTTQDINNLVSGTYTVTVTDINGCTTEVSGITINQPAVSLNGNVSSTTNVNCYGGNNGAINLSVNGGTTPYSYQWSNGATTQNLSNLPSGAYTITVTDVNGCTTEVSGIAINQPVAGLNANIVSSSNVSCFGSNDGSLTLNVNGGTSPYIFNWSNGATSQNLSNVAAGTYSVTITDDNGCSFAITGQTISQPPAALNGSVSSSANVSCFGGSNGSINLSVSGGTAPYSYNWSNGATTQNQNNISTGNYSVTITDANGCTTAVSSVIIDEPASPLSGSVATTQNVSCNSGGNGSVSLTVSGGTAPYAYMWSNGETTQNISGLYSGTYVVTITDIQGCSTSATGTVSQPAGSLGSTINVDQNVNCFGGNSGSINLNVTGGTSPYSYNWSNGATSQNISNLSAGTYTVTITDANGCLNVATAVVQQPAASLNGSASATTNVSCYGGNNGDISISVNGGTSPYSYQWNNGATSQNISNLSAGTYTVTVTDLNGCTTEITGIAINEPAIALNGSASSTTNVSCFGGNNGAINLTVNGGTSPYSFQWSNGANTQNINNLSSGTYTVTITDNNGCTTEVSGIAVTQPAGSLTGSASASANVSCFGGSNGTIDLIVNGGTSPYSYQWSNGGTTQDLTNLSSGTYSVIVTDANGCTFNASTTVIQPAAALSGNATVTQNVNCFTGATGAIDLTINNGTSPYIFSWSNAETTEDISNLSAGTYTVIVTDANGCTFNASATITQPSGSLSASAAVSQNVNCYSGANGAIDLTITSGTAPYTYNWSNGATTEDISNLTSGTYSVTVNDANGCLASSSAVIIQPSGALSATVNAAQNVSCFAGTNGSIDLNVTSGTAPYSFSWSNSQATEDITSLSAGTYSVTVTDANGCTFIASSTISQPSASLNGNAVATQNVNCNSGANGTIDLTVTDGTSPDSYNWSNGGTTEDLNNLSSGTFTVTVTDANGCTFTTSATVTQPAGSLNAGTNVSQNVSCYGGTNGSIDLTVTAGTAPYSYNWNNGSTTEDINGLNAGTYNVTVTDANGCIANATATITQPSAGLNVSINNSQNVSCYSGVNGSIDLTVVNGTAPYTFNWSNAATTEDLSNLSAGTYTVTVTDANGCTSIVSLNITQPTAALNGIANVSQNVSCNSGSNGAIDLTVIDGTLPYSYSWSNGTTTEDLNNLSSGTFTVTVTDASGCTFTTSATITQPSGVLNGSANVTQNINCFAGSNGAIDLTVTAGTSPYIFNWSNGLSSEDINNLSAGTYTVTVTDANGCTYSTSAAITQPSGALNAAINSMQNVSCNGGANGTIDLTVSAGTAPYTFNWSNGASTEDLNNLSSGTYTVTITDANGCTSNASSTITQPSASLNANTSVTQNVLCNAGSDGSVDLIVNGGTAPYSYNWSNGSSTQDLNNLSSGIYTVTITDANGCTTNASATITQPAGSLNANTSVIQNVLCNSGSDGSVDLTVNGGTAPYTFNWSNGATTEDLSNISSGTYTVTITDTNGCTANASAIIIQPSGSLNANASATQNVLCNSGSDGSVDLTVNGGTAPYSYNWSNGASTEDLNNLSSGTYAVTITDSNGCIANASATITQPSASLNANATVTQNVLCNSGTDGSVDLTVNGGTSPYSYNWSNGSSTEDLNNLSSGTYTVTITDANGCTTNASVTITQPSSSLNANAAATHNVLCYSGTDGSVDLTVNGGTSPYSYNWSNGASTEDLNNLSSGTYTVTITDANGCTANASATITQPSSSLNANAAATHNVLCNSGTDGSVDLTVNGGTSPYSYNWSNGASTEDLNNLSSGTYTVTITDANGCTANVSATITQPLSSLSANATATHNVLCNAGTDGSIDLTVNGGTSPYSYNWSNGASTEDLNNLTSGTYAVTITDANGCTTNASATITQPTASLNANATVTQNVLCNAGSDGSIDLTVNGGTAPYSYNWSNGATIQDLNNISSGTYTVTITDANGCSNTASAIVTQPSNAIAASASVTQTVSCFGGSNGMVSLIVSGGTSPYSFIWSNGATTQNLTNVTSGTYSVTITDANGCTQTASIIVLQPAASISVTGTGSSSNCLSGISGNVNITVNGGSSPFTYQWNNGATTQNLSNVGAGTYTVTVTDLGGCTTQGNYVVTDNSSFSAGAAGPTDICIGELVMLIADSVPGATYQWYMNGQLLGGATDNIFITPAAGSYTVTVTNSCGSFTSDSIVVKVHTIDNISVSPNVIICPGESTQLLATGGVSYEWTPINGLSYTNIPNPIATPDTTTHYTVTITNDFGCKTTALVQVAVMCDSLIIPSGYSPNGDAVNDAFVIKGIENYPGNKIWIYNRWGNLVYKAHDYDNKWDGYSNVSGIYIGKKVPSGTYFYVLDLNNNTKPLQGYIVLRY
jgi:gliding motility-associated-like protein